MPLAFLTADLPGTGGVVRTRPEDFRVDELPAYRPVGQGEHLYLCIEKTGIPTEAVVTDLVRCFGVAPEAVGYAGKKDAQAVTTQWLSVHTARDWAPEPGGQPRWRVLEVSRHTNKLRLGHLHGNRFTLVVRDCAAPQHAGPILERLREGGLPNYFGPQRLGPHNGTAQQGRRLVRAGRAPTRRHLERHRFAVNAYQAALFNALVHQRLGSLRSLGRMLAGDLAVLHRNGAAFPVVAAELEATQARADAGELSASAPLFGYRTDLATGEPGAWEHDLLAREALTLDAFRLGSKRASPRGERRAVRVLPTDLAWELLPAPDERAVRLRFTLPPGSYATALLREVTKAPDPTLLPPPAAMPAPDSP